MACGCRDEDTWGVKEEAKSENWICSGGFDCLYVGHLNFLERSKGASDYLIAGMCGDNYERDKNGVNI